MGNQDLDPRLATFHLSAKLLPRTVAGHLRGIGPLQMDQGDVAEGVGVEAGEGAKIARKSLAREDGVDPLLKRLECLFDALVWRQLSWSRVILSSRHIRRDHILRFP